MPIQVALTDQTGNDIYQTKMMEDVPVSQLIPAIITALRRPLTDNAGRQITYHLSHENRRLEEQETLESANVQPGDTLVLVPEMTAGGSTGDMGAPLVMVEAAVKLHEPLQPFPASYRAAFKTDALQVSLAPATMRKVWKHAQTSLAEEVGGILLGEVYEGEGGFGVRVERALAAEYTQAALSSVTFTVQSWLDLGQQRERFPTARVVGWYHSHPGFGIFLSGSDQFIHRHFFGAHPWYLALVVDPISSEWGFFTWQRGEIQTYPTYQGAGRIHG